MSGSTKVPPFIMPSEPVPARLEQADPKMYETMRFDKPVTFTNDLQNKNDP